MNFKSVPPALNAPVPIYTPVRVKSRNRTARSGDGRTNHEATAPPVIMHETEVFDIDSPKPAELRAVKKRSYRLSDT